MVLVTGGTGLVGSHLLYFLSKRNDRVRAVYRKNADIDAVKNVFALYTPEVDPLFKKIEWVEANLNDIPALSEAFTGVTTVYHCAALITFDPAKYKLLKKINVEGTANIVNISLAHNVAKLCYVSSVATLGATTNNQLITEETPWNPEERNSVYAITKYNAEMEVWRGAQEGLDVVIVNPGVIIATPPSTGGSGAIFSTAARGIPFYPTGTMGVVDVVDVAKSMVLLMDSPIKNEHFVLVAENISYKKLISSIAVLFGKTPPTLKLSKGFMYILSGVDWILGKFFGTKRSIPRAVVRSMFTKSLYDSGKLKAATGFQFTPVSTTLKRIAREQKEASN